MDRECVGIAAGGGMKLVVFGLSVSSSWGNGHATLWRGLIKALARRKHHVVFFERDVPYYAGHRDLKELPAGELCLYPDWVRGLPLARAHIADADVAIVTSFCPDGIAASELVLDSNLTVRVFYDLDAPVTLEDLSRGKKVDYIAPRGLADFDLVLSYTGGRVLEQLKNTLGAKRVVPLYGSVDPDVHRPVRAQSQYEADLSYLGTYAEDRQQKLEALFLEPARRLPGKRFVMGGSLYPESYPWTANIHFVRHLPPSEHPAFYSSSKLTLNVTRAAMAKYGYCPQGRLFEAAACGTPVLTDHWEGLDHFFRPGEEILVAQGTEEAIAAVTTPARDLARIASAARERTLSEHTAERRAIELEAALESVYRAHPPATSAAVGRKDKEGA
jgi:spore maturation protein CgeB